MTWNDPLRRYELAQRLQRLREQGESVPDVPLAEGADLTPDLLGDDERLRALVSRVMAEMSATEAPAVPAAAEPAAPRWQDEWWSPAAGPTERARQVFGGPDGWMLAWVLHRRTGLPLAAVEEREAGSRLRFWVRRHLVVDILDGRYLDVEGPADGDTMIARHTSRQAASRRVLALRHPPRWRDLEVPDGRREPWQEVLTTAPPEAVELVADELATRHGLGAPPGPGRPAP
ncbi:MAG: hypothetical protein ACFCVG_18405 [Kineosporiaceae bacterium]